jgi:ribosomal protein S18 acetylase RimI-like enzyme
MESQGKVTSADGHADAEGPQPELIPAGERDLGLLEAMVRAYYAEDGHRFDEQRQLPALRAMVEGDPMVRGWRVVLAGRTVGYAVLTLGFSLESGGRDGIIDELYLIPEVRNRGVGREVMALIEAEARALGVRCLLLEVQHANPAVGFYRRAGYVDHRRHLMSKFL